MSIEEKNEYLKRTIINKAISINNTYGKELIDEDKVIKAVDIIKNQTEFASITEKTEVEDFIQKSVDLLAQKLIEDYLKYQRELEEMMSKKQKEKNSQNDRDSKTFQQIKSVYNKVNDILEKNNLTIYTSGGSVPYLISGEDSNRLHDDIDNVCKLEDMDKLRDVFKTYGLYQEEWDSKTYAKDDIDYGFEMKIDNVPFGIYPFTYDENEKMLTQYTYDPYTHECKVKKQICEDLKDYVTTYTGKDNKKYNTMSLEFIKYTKDKANREKDVIDSKKISEIGYKKEVYDRIKPFKEIQKIKAENIQARTKEKGNVKVLKKNNHNKGFASTLLLTLIVGFTTGIVTVITILLISKFNS